MKTRLMDVHNKYGKIMHTFPIELADEGIDDEETAYHEKALQAAAFAHLVPDEELQTITARNHVSRGGPLEPYADRLPVTSQTKAELEQEIREQAYLLWERDGCPEGRDEDYWNWARHDHLQKRAYVLWKKNGCREGNADEDWEQARRFDEQ